MLFRFDRASPAKLGAVPIAVTPEGYKVYRGVAAFGDVVLEYPEFGRNEFVSAEDALGSEALATLIGVPFTILHPDELLSSDDPDAVKDHVEGTVIKAVANMEASPPELVVDVMVWTAPAQEAIESGRVRDLSPGYGCGDERAPSGAIRDGKAYSVIQRRRQYNHLSGVVTARGVTPDGRRARLDEAAPLASYAHDVEEDIAETVDPTETDVEANLEEDLDAPPAMDPAEALAAFSPEAAEILKTLPPDDLAILSGMALGAKAEAAEEAVIAGAVEPVVEVEEVDAAAASSVPAALTADAVKQMIADAIAGMGGKMDALLQRVTATATTVSPAVAPAASTAPRADAATQAAERKRIEAEVRAERDFVDAVRRRGGRCDSVAEATSHALAVVKAADPGLLPVAEDAVKRGRRDHLLSLFGAADDRRRRGHLDGQESALFAVTEADDEYHRGRADAAGATGSVTPAYLDFGGPVGPATGAA